MVSARLILLVCVCVDAYRGYRRAAEPPAPPPPSQGVMTGALLYETLYRAGYHNHTGLSRGAPLMSELNKMSRRLGEPVRTALDVGCSHGLVVKDLWLRGIEANGVDISPTAVQLARSTREFPRRNRTGMIDQPRGRRPSPRCGEQAPCFQTASATMLPFASNSFDVVLSSDVLEQCAPAVRGLGRFGHSLAHLVHASCIRTARPACVHAHTCCVPARRVYVHSVRWCAVPSLWRCRRSPSSNPAGGACCSMQPSEVSQAVGEMTRVAKRLMLLKISNRAETGGKDVREVLKQPRMPDNLHSSIHGPDFWLARFEQHGWLLHHMVESRDRGLADSLHWECCTYVLQPATVPGALARSQAQLQNASTHPAQKWYGRANVCCHWGWEQCGPTPGPSKRCPRWP